MSWRYVPLACFIVGSLLFLLGNVVLLLREIGWVK
jgi:hypothetical protein